MKINFGVFDIFSVLSPLNFSNVVTCSPAACSGGVVGERSLIGSSSDNFAEVLRSALPAQAGVLSALPKKADRFKRQDLPLMAEMPPQAATLAEVVSVPVGAPWPAKSQDAGAVSVDVTERLSGLEPAAWSGQLAAGGTGLSGAAKAVLSTETEEWRDVPSAFGVPAALGVPAPLVPEAPSESAVAQPAAVLAALEQSLLLGGVSSAPTAVGALASVQVLAGMASTEPRPAQMPAPTLGPTPAPVSLPVAAPAPVLASASDLSRSPQPAALRYAGHEEPASKGAGGVEAVVAVGRLAASASERGVYVQSVVVAKVGAEYWPGVRRPAMLEMPPLSVSSAAYPAQALPAPVGSLTTEALASAERMWALFEAAGQGAEWLQAQSMDGAPMDAPFALAGGSLCGDFSPAASSAAASPSSLVTPGRTGVHASGGWAVGDAQGDEIGRLKQAEPNGLSLDLSFDGSGCALVVVRTDNEALGQSLRERTHELQESMNGLGLRVDVDVRQGDARSGSSSFQQDRSWFDMPMAQRPANAMSPVVSQPLFQRSQAAGLSLSVYA